jgi:hypothetical protein
MILIFGDLKVRVQMTNEGHITSKHTGKTLAVLQVTTTVRGKEANDNFLKLIEKAKEDNISSLDETGNLSKNWKVKNTSWSYRDGDSIYNHTLELEEVEELKLDYLDVSGLVIKPYDYQEKIDTDGISIESKAILSEEQHNQLKAMLKTGDSLSVVRYGINETPIEMHFGAANWSKYENNFKHEILLIEDTMDKSSNKLAAAFQWVRSMRNFVAEHQIIIDGLLTVLVAKNIITSEEVEKIRIDALDQSWNVRYEFFKVDDIDEM